MLLGACIARRCERVLECSPFIPRLIRLHVSTYPDTTKSGSQNHTMTYQVNVLANPIPSKIPLLPDERLRLLRFLNETSPDVQFTSPADWRLRPRPSPFDHDIASSYLSIRMSPQSVGELSSQAYLLIAKQAQLYRLQHIMGMLVDDLLNHFPRGLDPEGFSRAAAAILSLATPDCPLAPERTLRLYDALRTSGAKRPQSLSPKAWDRVFSAAITHPEFRLFSLESFASRLLSTARTGQVDAKSIWITYRIIIHLLMEGEESFPEALTVFRRLVELDRVPKVVQRLAQEQGGSFKVLIANTLVKGCLQYNWYVKAVELMIELLQDTRWSQASGTSAEDIRFTLFLGLEVLHKLVLSPTRQEVHMCRKLIQALLPTSLTPSEASPPLVDIPHADILAFYEACYNFGLMDDAASVYVHLQSSRIRHHHYYPPPRGSALFWLFDHFADPGMSSKIDGRQSAFKGCIKMARVILNDILTRGVPVPVVDRPRFIALAAGRGFGYYARQLWELYTAEGDPDRDVVRGNGQMLVPIVKLFRKLQEAWDGSIEHQQKAVTKAIETQDNSTDDRTSDVKSSGPTAKHLTSMLPGTKKSVLPTAWRFANHVLNSYIAAKEPLALASQEDLNALARAHLILDHIPEGIEALSIVMERGDIPDAKDVNVALGAIARYSPRRAAHMIEAMVTRGVVPTPSAFSAVLHVALKDEDFKLVGILLQRARKLGYGDLTPRAIAALVNAMIYPKEATDPAGCPQQRSNLTAVMKTIETVISVPSTQRHHKDHGKDHVLSVKMAHKCIEAALVARWPEIAMRFWRLLVRDRVLWEERESRNTRALIGRTIRVRWKARRLHEEEARSMLAELGEPDENVASRARGLGK